MEYTSNNFIITLKNSKHKYKIKTNFAIAQNVYLHDHESKNEYKNRKEKTSFQHLYERT